VLEPGEKKTFQLEIDGKAPGRYRTWLQFKAGAQTFDLPVQAEVLASQRPSIASNNSPSSSFAITDSNAPPVTPESATDESPGPTQPEWIGDFQVPKGVQVSHITQTSAVIEWPASLAPGISRFRVEMRQLKKAPDGTLEISWVRPTGIPIESRGATFTARLTDLQPGQPWTVRILPLEANGEVGDRLFTVDFSTQWRPSLMARVSNLSPLKWMFGVLAALLFWWGVQRWLPRRQA
jgi:hypothetical protein